MANELRTKYGAGSTVYAIILRASDGNVWNGSTFEALAEGNWTSYAIPLTEQGGTGIYFGTMPVPSAGIFDVWNFKQLGASPAPSDLLIGQASLDWNGIFEGGFYSWAGEGSIKVDHDYPTADNLKYINSQGDGIADATISIYTKSDFENNNLDTRFIKAQTTTITSGKWQKSIYLNAADYVLRFYKVNAYGPDDVPLTVS